jgi:hypothetical protein
MLKIYTPIAHIQSHTFNRNMVCWAPPYVTPGPFEVYIFRRVNTLMAENRVIAENTAASRADDEIAESV